jgi:CBS domain-containing protein
MGLWLALVGFFLFDAARAVTRTRKTLRTAGDAMTAPVSVEPESTVGHFVDHVLPLHRQEVVAVARGQSLHGILSLRDLKDLPRERWHLTRVSDVMRPVAPQLFVAPQTPLARAERLINDNGAGAVAVVNNEGHLVGLLLRGRVKRRSQQKD